jgi:hypothetical protein
MTKTTLALAAALLAGTTLTSAANAGGVRVGFGFPLGSFVAHSNQSYSGEGYGSGRNCHKPRYAARRRYEAAAAPVRKVKRAPKAAVAYKVSKPEVQTAKLEDKLITNDETTTEIAKTPASDVSGTQSTTSTTTAVLDKEPAKTATTATPATAKVEAPKIEKVATVEKTETSGKAEQKTISVPAAKRVCRRFSAAIAGLVDVPCQ